MLSLKTPMIFKSKHEHENYIVRAKYKLFGTRPQKGVARPKKFLTNVSFLLKPQTALEVSGSSPAVCEII